MQPPERNSDGSADDPVAVASAMFTGPDGRSELLALLRERHGDEAAGRLERSMALSADPRPLTAAERMIVRETAAPVLRDMAATGAIVLDVREEAHEDQGPEVVCAWVASSVNRAAMGVTIDAASPAGERVAALAEQLQEFELEELWAAGRSATWPECPQHPDFHPLAPAVHDGVAMWLCPQSRDVICGIGAIGTAGPAEAAPHR